MFPQQTPAEARLSELMQEMGTFLPEQLERRFETDTDGSRTLESGESVPNFLQRMARIGLVRERGAFYVVQRPKVIL